MDWWILLLVIVVLAAVAAVWWWSSGRSPSVPEHGHRPGDENQFPKWGF
jgi:hypothetical protein